ncbi:hypothetical protein NDU88_001624 [Pleurodeles waltl]|uniref:Uncharacterized protein n=1 Tax=Pleurodeles waltl TaxID=8319 RepID=A0AAV7MLI6_PLEWA|nr:hypothetical protein NDU88_001624 [Pleurodeles waltl]
MKPRRVPPTAPRTRAGLQQTHHSLSPHRRSNAVQATPVRSSTDQQQPWTAGMERIGMSGACRTHTRKDRTLVDNLLRRALTPRLHTQVTLIITLRPILRHWL